MSLAFIQVLCEHYTLYRTKVISFSGGCVPQNTIPYVCALALQKLHDIGHRHFARILLSVESTS